MSAIPEGPWLPTVKRPRNYVAHWPTRDPVTGALRAWCEGRITLDLARELPPRSRRSFAPCKACTARMDRLPGEPPASRRPYQGDPVLRHVGPGQRAALHVWEEWLDLGVEQGLSRQTVAGVLGMSMPAFERAMYRHAKRTGQPIPRWATRRVAA